ncbi:hypothetical protein ACRYCC_23395 [Actinomadura scrupuli]|uniref:hypothetical protein n=1 Tax=Actinomadura scrupuli TaxID=559629 RepID=UPI003D98AB5D
MPDSNGGIFHPSEFYRWTAIPGTTVKTWLDQEALDILHLVADLPAGEVMRCFLPVYGIRAHSIDQLLFEIAFCFQCHYALVLRPAPRQGSDVIGFDAGSRRAKDLLARFRAL